MDSIAQVLEIVAGILLLGAVGEFVFSRTGIPDVVWLVYTGVLVGPVFEIVSPSLLQPAVPLFGAIALTIIPVFLAAMLAEAESFNSRAVVLVRFLYAEPSRQTLAVQ